MYYDFDGGRDASEPSTQINAMMYNIVQKMALDKVPTQVYAELNNGITPTLFPHVTKDDEPNDANKEAAIRQNLAHLTWNFWGKKYATDHSEIDALYQLLQNSQNLGLARVAALPSTYEDGVSNYIDDRAHRDQRYVMRAWTTLLVYLINDPEFLYE